MRAEIKDPNMAEERTTAQNIVGKVDGAIDGKNVIHSLYTNIDTVTEGLDTYLRKQLKEQVSIENSGIISDYALVQKTKNLSENYRSTTLSIIILFCKAVHNKPFSKLTRDAILSYLDSLRKPEGIDPLHKWIGSYNLRRECLAKFFKWLDSQGNASRGKHILPIINSIPRLKRKEQSVYKPTDLWTREEDLLFLRYCPSKRDRCYHAISRDASARPHEILKLKIKDIVFKFTPDKKQYAEILLNGKTGSRHIPLFNSIPYIKDYLDHEHPQSGNPNAPLICGLDKSLGRPILEISLLTIYGKYKKGFFPKLLDNDSHNVPPEDKQKISEILKK